MPPGPASQKKSTCQAQEPAQKAKKEVGTPACRGPCVRAARVYKQVTRLVYGVGVCYREECRSLSSPLVRANSGGWAARAYEPRL